MVATRSDAVYTPFTLRNIDKTIDARVIMGIRKFNATKASIKIFFNPEGLLSYSINERKDKKNAKTPQAIDNTTTKEYRYVFVTILFFTVALISLLEA